MHIMMDQSRLKREFTEENLTAWAEYLAEKNRANFYHKRDGWSKGTVVDFDESGWAQIELKWGNDHNDHEQYSDLVEYTVEEYQGHFDRWQKNQTNQQTEEIWWGT